MSEFIDNLVEEETNLALHTKLCAQRYQQITDKFDHIDQRLDTIEDTLVEIKNVVTTDRGDNYKRFLGWAGVIITGLLGITGYLISHYVIK